MYHGKGDIPLPVWRKEMRRLYRLIKDNAGDVPLPEKQEFQPVVNEFQVRDFSEDLVPADAWQLSRY